MQFKFFNFKHSQLRHLLKSFTWRFIASIDTFLLSYILSSDFKISISISSVELITKLILYYLHERFWFNSNLANSKIRHLVKPFTWRAIGTLDTLIISSLLFDDFFMGAQLASFETLTKLVLYYLHDKLWYKLKFGLDEKK